MKVKKRGKGKGNGGGEAICSQIPRVLKGWLMTCATVCPLGDGERKPTLPLPLSDDTLQLAAGISLPTKLPDRLTKCFKRPSVKYPDAENAMHNFTCVALVKFQVIFSMETDLCLNHTTLVHPENLNVTEKKVLNCWILVN